MDSVSGSGIFCSYSCALYQKQGQSFFCPGKIGDRCNDEISFTNLFIQNTNSKIQGIDIDLKDFVTSLAQKYHKKSSTPESSLATNRNLPSAFISYVRENQKKALELAEILKNSQINPLIDLYELKSGDNWEKKLENLITQKANYFIYLLSRDLLNQSETVAYQEKNLALQRQTRVKDGLRFFLPLQIDDCDIPLELQKYHVENDVTKIIAAIKSDFETRNA